MNSKSRIISTDEDPSLRIESSAIINLRGASTKLNKYNLCKIKNHFKIKVNLYLFLKMLMWSVSLLAIKVENSWINYLIEFRSGSFTNALAHAITIVYYLGSNFTRPI